MAGPKCPYSEVPLYHIIFVSVSADSKDLRGVLDYLGSKQGKCYDIGSALGLSEDWLEKIRSECPSDNNTKALRTIIYDWLKKKYDTKQHGPPTWKALVEAVESSLGGDDPELAERIAKDHPPQPSEGILIRNVPLNGHFGISHFFGEKVLLVTIIFGFEFVCDTLSTVCS